MMELLSLLLLFSLSSALIAVLMLLLAILCQFPFPVRILPPIIQKGGGRKATAQNGDGIGRMERGERSGGKKAVMVAMDGKQQKKKRTKEWKQQQVIPPGKATTARRGEEKVPPPTNADGTDTGKTNPPFFEIPLEAEKNAMKTTGSNGSSPVLPEIVLTTASMKVRKL